MTEEEGEPGITKVLTKKISKTFVFISHRDIYTIFQSQKRPLSVQNLNQHRDSTAHGIIDVL